MKTNFIEFKYHCDFCQFELSSYQRKITNRSKTFLNQIKYFLSEDFDPRYYIQSKQWHLYMLESSNIIENKLSKFIELQKIDNLSLENHKKLLNKDYIYLCDSHFREFEDFEILKKVWYCTNCGKEYSLERAEKFGVNIAMGIFYVDCKNCNETAIADRIIAKIEKKRYLQSCMSCRKENRIDINEYGEVNPLNFIKHCSKCGGNLQNLEIITYIWSRKKLISSSAEIESDENRDKLDCKFYHENYNKFPFCPICGKQIKQ